jgi:hypothetical protein
VLPAASLDKEGGFGAGQTGVEQLAALVAAIAASEPQKGRQVGAPAGRRVVEADEAVRS